MVKRRVKLVEAGSRGNDRLRLYLATNLTHGWTDRLNGIYFQIVKLFVDQGFSVFAPALDQKPGSPDAADEIYARNCSEVLRSDLIMFLRFHPSIGAGTEAKIASDGLVPWGQVALRDDSFEATPLLKGLANPPAGVNLSLETDNPRRCLTALEEKLASGEIHRRVRDVQSVRHQTLRDIESARIGELLLRQRLLLGLSAREVALRTGVRDWLIEVIENDHLALARCPLLLLLRLLSVVRLRFTEITDGCCPSVEPVDHINASLLEAASDFARYGTRMRSKGELARSSDSEMVAQWRDWCRGKGLNPQLALEPIDVEPVGLRAIHLILPMSNLFCPGREDERCERDRVRDAIKARLRNRGLEIIDPSTDYVVNAPRDESGSEVNVNTLVRLLRSDLGLAIVSPPATGVGIVSEAAAGLTIPRAWIGSGPVSRMFLGSPGVTVESAHAGSAAELDVRGLCECLCDQRVLAELMSHASHRRQIIERVNVEGQNRGLLRYCLLRGQKPEDLARVAHVDRLWVEAVVRQPQLAPCMTLAQLVQIALNVEGDIRISESGVPDLSVLTEATKREQPDPRFRDIMISDLQVLVELVGQEEYRWLSVADAWKRRKAELLASVHKGKALQKMSETDWHELLKEDRLFFE